MNLLLTLILLTNLAVLACLLVAFIKISRAYAVAVRRVEDLYEQFRDFISPGPADSEGKPAPSPFAAVCLEISDMLARALVARVKTTFMGKASGEARAEASLDTDIALDLAAQQNPVAGLIGQIPGVRKTLKRNPQLLDAAINMFMKRAGSGSAPVPSAGNNGHSSITKFKF